MLSAPPKMPTSVLLAHSPLIWACEKATIIHPTRGRIPFRPYSYQSDFLQDKARRRLVVKARQIGWSQVVAIEAIHKAIFSPDSTILFVSRNEKQASHLLGYCYAAISGIRDEVPVPVRQNQSEMVFANGSHIISLPANKSTGRGFAAGDVYLDEYAFQEYAADIYRSIVPTLSHGGRLTVFSTPDGRANHFYQLWAGIEAGEWSRYLVWCPGTSAQPMTRRGTTPPVPA
jgi:phage FluMu gp28-like protein